MALIVDEIGAFFRIREFTKNEFVAVGSDGNILRWSASNGDDQLWLVIPVGDRSYRIMTKQNGEYMAVGSDGNIRRWKSVEGPTQVFRLVNGDTDTFNIQEGTENEFVAVGSNGNILRWAKSGGVDQKFRFEPWKAKGKPVLPKVDAEPGQIGDVPRLKGFDFTELPETTKPKTVAFSVIPATSVYDPAYSDKIAQMEANPYYVARRSQYWSRNGAHGYAYEHQPGGSDYFEKKLVYEASSTTSQTIEETTGTKFSVEGGFSLSGVRKGISGTMSGGVSYEVSHELKTTLVSAGTVTRRKEDTVSRTYDKNQHFTICGWSLIDRYELLRADLETVVSGEDVGSWNSLKTDQFPSDVPPPTRR
jgi:Insecticidal Crystal Toxin, P42